MFSELKKRIFAFFTNMSVKKLLLLILIAICILFPTILAISNAIYTKIKSKEPEDIPTVIIYDISGNELFREQYTTEELGNDSLANIFIYIKENLEKTTPITAEVATEKPLVAEIIDKKGVTKLTCYFSFTHGSSYCVDPSGQYYKIPNTYSDYFLSSAFAELLYTDATPPALNTPDGQKITPETATWKYKTIDGSFKQANLIRTTSEVITYDFSGAISLSFARKPDTCIVTIHDGNAVIFNDTLDRLDNITLDTSTELLLTIKADWNEGKGRYYNGSVTYKFNVIIHNRAEFSTSSDVLSSDGIVLLKATNISDPSKLKITLPSATASQKAYFIGETAYVAIPYPLEYTGDTYPVNVSYGISSKTFNLTLDDTPLSIDDVSTTLNALDIDNEIFQLTTNDKIFLAGSLYDPSSLGYTKASVIGDLISTHSGDQISPFTAYTVSGGSGLDVRASVGGRVCFVGNNYPLGEYVVIDCGLGIKLWYFGLSEVSVKVGEFIATGDFVGTTDTLTFGGGEGFYLMASCNNNVINTDVIFNGIIK